MEPSDELFAKRPTKEEVEFLLLMLDFHREVHKAELDALLTVVDAMLRKRKW